MHYRCRIRVLGGGCNEGDRAVLDALQQALLLLFVQVLDLVQIQQDAARPRQCADVLEHRLDVAGAAGSAVDLCRVMPLFSAMMRATVVLPVPDGP